MPKSKLRNGHAPSHIRNTALEAFETYVDWDGLGAEPTVEYDGRRLSLSQAMGPVWNCTDIVPGSEFDRLQDAQCRLHSYEPVIKRRTYAACARAVLSSIVRAA
jgi:hypothetical protein